MNTMIDYFIFIIDENELKKIINWLEQNKLQRFVSDKVASNKKDWNSFYKLLKENTQCPTFDNKYAELEWLLGLAIQIDYENDCTIIDYVRLILLYQIFLSGVKYNKNAVDNLKKSNAPNVIADNPLDNIDCKYM